MIAKLLWLQHHRPEVWQQTHRLCLISDYLTHLLTGQYVAGAKRARADGVGRYPPLLLVARNA